MWAQGLTIGLVIAAGALTQGKRAEAAKEVCTKSAHFVPLTLIGFKGIPRSLLERFGT